MAFKLKKRCVRCLKVLRDDGTCQNPNCVLYVDESSKSSSAEAHTTSGTSGTTDTSGEAK